MYKIGEEKKSKYNVGDFLTFTRLDGTTGYIKVTKISKYPNEPIWYEDCENSYVEENDVEGKLEGEELEQIENEYKLYLKLKTKFE